MTARRTATRAARPAGHLRIATRGSRLAGVQADLVRRALATHGVEASLVMVETDGDRRAADTPWGEGAFVAAIERALLEGRADLAVHSAKDVPTDERPGLVIAAFLERADPRDALVVASGSATTSVGGSLAVLPPGARVGTDSPRRTGFLRALRPDLRVHPLHGNVDTRIARLDAGETDALVLACAGLDRLGRADRIAERLDPDIVAPAPGQGAIAVQVRRTDEEAVRLVEAIDHWPTRLAVAAERMLLAATGGGCRSPIGALATIEADEMSLVAASVGTSGGDRRTAHGRAPFADGRVLAERLAAAIRPGAPAASVLQVVR